VYEHPGQPTRWYVLGQPVKTRPGTVFLEPVVDVPRDAGNSAQVVRLPGVTAFELVAADVDARTGRELVALAGAVLALEALAAQPDDGAVADLVVRSTMPLREAKARKGVLITTSEFTGDAKQYAAGIDLRIVLIGGQELAQLMIDHGIGVKEVATYRVYRADADYFADE
jgi:hypothetical protein